jgi:hypothetical protein
MLEAIERGVQRSLLNLQRVARDLLDAEEDAVAVFGTQRHGFENQEVQRALQEFRRRGHERALLERHRE